MPQQSTGRPAVDSIGIDLHKRESQLTITADGELIERRIVTSRERFTSVLGARSPARILLEASTESEWVARHLESLGHTVIVADPDFAAMYATRSKRMKTDKRDAGRCANRSSSAPIARSIAPRMPSVRCARTSRCGIRSCAPGHGTSRSSKPSCDVKGSAFPAATPSTPSPSSRHWHCRRTCSRNSRRSWLVALWAPLNAEIAATDARLLAFAKGPIVTRLQSMPSIGPVTALAFVASLDDVTRFHSAHQVQGYLGLVPSEYSSGDRRLRGRITKRGDARMRWLLVEAAWRILRSPNPALAGLRAWAQQIAERRGKRIATVALARRIAGILYAMWRDDVDYAVVPLRAVAA
jgi:transposase